MGKPSYTLLVSFVSHLVNIATTPAAGGLATQKWLAYTGPAGPREVTVRVSAPLGGGVGGSEQQQQTR